ncbi:hypothetical protein [Neolewinella litorea]|uniref:Uncharacterized protein n=1 Tax=Neolewinella litorea TaxID=2562452 RepID=A0A4S4NRW3_9BACT|nr:hypothetical protein [Neolewinella litorea]THH41128.1 hypothetical protein E4021_00600 [Neolewinella litorea]
MELRTAVGLLACIWLLPLSGQDNSRFADELTLADGTTLQVDLRKTGATELAQSISFTVPEGGERSLTPSMVAEFQFGKTGRTYRQVAVELPYPRSTDPPTEQLRFGEVLASGDVELIKVALSSSEYDLEAADGEPYLYLLREGEVELVLKLSSIMVYERLHANPARFRNLLKFLTRDCPRALAMARTANFADSDILRVLDAYGDCDAGRQVILDRSLLRGGVRIEHYARGFNIDIRDGDFSDRQLSAGLGYLAMARFNERFRRLAVLASLDFVYHSFRWEMISDVSQSMVRGNFSLGYTVSGGEKLGLQLTAGLSNYNAISSGFRSFFSNNYFLLNGGANLHSGNFLLGVHYEYLPGQISRRPGNQLVTTLGYRVVL